MYDPEKMPISGRETGPDPRAEAADAVRKFIEEHDMGPEAVEDALFMMIDAGLGENDGGAKDETVYSLAGMLQDAESKGVPLNELTRILVDRQYLAGAPERCRAFVGNLPLGERERETLVSILDRNRTGTLSFVDSDTGRDMVQVTIPAEAAEAGPEYRALWLESALKEISERMGTRKYGITFEEA